MFYQVVVLTYVQGQTLSCLNHSTEREVDLHSAGIKSITLSLNRNIRPNQLIKTYFS